MPLVAERMRAARFIAHCQHSAHLRQAALHWTHGHVADIGQSALCHRFHTVRQRLCGWLLRSARSVDAMTIHVTQEGLSHTLGSPRSTVSAAALHLQDHGLIRLRHGRVQLVNRRGLEACACECHVVNEGMTSGR
jgi:CRP-like cAMP-binding protein